MSRKTEIIEELGIKKKYCTSCHNLLPLEAFSINRSNSSGRRSHCRVCINNNIENKILNKIRCSEYYLRKRQRECRAWKRDNIKEYLYNSAKTRAKQRNEEFSIDLEDIIVPELCPLLGIKMQYNEGIKQDNSYSLDRIDSTKGYIKDNVWVVSLRANRIKNDSTIEELEMILNNLKLHINSQHIVKRKGEGN